MRPALEGLSLIITFFLLSESSLFAQLSISQMAEKCPPSVVTIIPLSKKGQPLSSGSGFFLDDSGLIATSHHVLFGASRAIIRTFEGQEGEIIEVTQDDPRLDLAIARTSLRKTLALGLGDSDQVQVNEPIVAIGNAPGWRGIVSTGRVSGIRKAEDIQLLLMTAPVSPGCSGGPVLNMRGQVIGVATAYIASEKELGFAMPSNYLKSLSPARLKLADLPPMLTTFKAELIDRTVTEVLLIRDQEDLPSEAPVLSPPPHARTGTVYFKNGRRVLCDRAWKEGKTIFLVIHGKGYAIGYEESQIDMEKSFL